MAHRARLPLQSNTISAHKSQHGVLGSTMLLNNNKKSSSLALKAATVPPPADWQAWQSKKITYEYTTLAPRYASEDWLYNLLSIFSSAMFWRVSSHLFANTLFAVAIWCAYLLMPSLQAVCAGFSTVPHSLTGGALGLLLVFRTNTAYERFLDARKLWGSMVNRIREFTRVIHGNFRGLDREHLLSLLACFPSILLQHLQSLEPVYRPTLFSDKQLTAMKGLLGDSDLKLLWASRNRPFTIIKMMGAIIQKFYTDVEAQSKKFGGGQRGENFTQFESMVVQAALISERSHAEECLTEFSNVMGACERIVKSSVPTSYSRHTSRFLSIWCFTLPLVLVHSLQWRMIPCVFIMCWMLFVIEEVGHVIEDPFNIHLSVPGSGREDELRIEASLSVLRGDVLERIPATAPHLLENQGNFITDEDYKPSEFHYEWMSTAKK
uniref:Uncharacterized protein n=1 Tax=Guillardia theta TaxID=55529 RepID=A0A7S4PQ23_GUITH